MYRYLIRTARRANVLFLVLAAFAVSTKPAHAYIDPGTGSYVLQVVAAGIFTAIFAIGAFWKKIKSGITSMFGRKDKSDG